MKKIYKVSTKHENNNKNCRKVRDKQSNEWKGNIKLLQLTVLWRFILCWVHAWQCCCYSTEELQRVETQQEVSTSRFPLHFWNRSKLTSFTLYPALALVSINITLSSFAFRSPSSVDTCRLSERSVLLPTNMIITSLPRSVRTSSIHFDVWWNELASEMELICVWVVMARPSAVECHIYL